MTNLNKPRILLIGWDAADWQHIDPLLEAGEMPALQSLIGRGVRGNLASLMPMVSPMLWTSIASGKTADQHGVHGFVEPDPVAGGARPWSSLSRTTKAIWNILHQNDYRCSTVGWWASHPAEPLRGTVVSNLFLNSHPAPGGGWQIPAGAVHPADAAARFARLRMDPSEMDSSAITAFIPRAAEIDQDKDRRLEALARVFSSTVSIQAAATEIMEHEPWDFMAVYFDGVDHFCHGFMPYHPPRLPHISAEDFEIYSDVVRNAYRFHDMMLERQLQLAGPDAIVILCSDHGFLSGANRPLADPNDPAGPTLWHREMGILVMAGPGIASGKRIYGASLLDITPTILTLCGLPCGRDMQGKPLLEALTDVNLQALLPQIESWDHVPGEDGSHGPGVIYPSGSKDGGEVLRQLAALGYVEETGGDEEKAAEAAMLESHYNLAEVHISRNQPEQAATLLRNILEIRPWESRYIHQLALALTNAGWHRQCVDLLLAAYPESDPELPMPMILLIMARALLGMGDRAGAGFYASRAARAMPVMCGAYIELADIFVALGNLEAAEHAARRAIALDESSAGAWISLAAIHLDRDENEQAVEAGMAAVKRIWQSGRAHFIIGLGLARMEQYQEARIALQRATVMLPRQPHPWRVLAALPDTPGAASGEFLREACRTRARLLSRQASVAGAERRQRAREQFTLPDFPPPSVRRATVNRARPPAASRITPALSGRTFTLVSGLPRSGTSLMMQMLAAGGLLPKTDGERAADEDNPEGYLEWESIRQVASRPGLFDEAGLDQLSIKCISALIRDLPPNHRYRVLYMKRPAEEIVRSQRRMIARRGTQGMDGPDEQIAASLAAHSAVTLQYLRSNPRAFDLIEIDYPALVADPAAFASRLAEFLGPDLLPHPERMAAAVRPDLYRNQQAADGTAEAGKSAQPP